MSKNHILTFNTAFNELHALLIKLLDVGDKTDFSLCLAEIRERSEHSVFFEKLNDKYGSDLKTINAIRNILIHKNDWIEVPLETIEKLGLIILGITQMEQNFHTKAIDIFGKKIFIGKESDTVEVLIEAMGVRSFSHVPIYSEDGLFKWVFSMKSLVLWLTKASGPLGRDTPIRDIQIDTKNSEYLFIPNDTRVSNIDEYFREYSKNRKKLWAIFLTKSGTPKDPIDGIITAWDLPLIYEKSNG